jgi:hypothetical protein
MTFIIDKDGPVPELESEIHRLRGLVHALEDIRRGRHPGKAALASCPKIYSSTDLDQWELGRATLRR